MFGSGYGGVFGGSQGNPFEGLQYNQELGWQQTPPNNLSPWSSGGIGGAFGGGPPLSGGFSQPTVTPRGATYPGRAATQARPFSGGYQPSQFAGFGGGQGYQLQGYGQRPQAPQPQARGGQGGMGDFAAPVDAGGIYGQQKWTGGNGIDIFVKRGSPIYAMFDGQISPYSGGQSPIGPVPGLILRGNNGMAAQYQHVQSVAQGPVRRGQIIGYVNDQSMDMLGQYPGMPDGYQHFSLTVGRGSGPFPLTGGDINAASFLQQIGYRGRQIQGQTRGPSMGGGGGGMGMGMGGMPGMGMPGMMSPFGGGMSPFGGGMGGMNPFMMQMGGFGRGMGR